MNTTISTRLLRIALFSIMLFQIPALTSCNKVGPDGNGDNTEENHELKGIWKVTNVRMGGAYLGDYTRLSYLIIDPESGEVTGQIDCTGLLPKSLRTSRTDVLNGVPYIITVDYR